MPDLGMTPCDWMPLIAATSDDTAGRSAAFPVQAGQPIQITKYVGIASSVDTDRKLAAATPQEAAATAR